MPKKKQTRQKPLKYLKKRVSKYTCATCDSPLETTISKSSISILVTPCKICLYNQAEKSYVAGKYWMV
jgi:transcription elongation factor Elf1